MNSVGCFPAHGKLNFFTVVFKIVVNIINVNWLVICTVGYMVQHFKLHPNCYHKKSKLNIMV